MLWAADLPAIPNGPRDRTQAIGFGSKCLGPLSYLARPQDKCFLTKLWMAPNKSGALKVQTP